jgi:uncharacterized RDD family membrane protein YckC
VTGPPVPPAELDRRFYAFVLDRLAGWTVAAIGLLLAYRFLIDGGRLTLEVVVAAVPVVLLVNAVLAVVLGLTGASPGTAALGLRVVSPGTRTPIGVGRALLRQATLGLAGLPTFGLGLATLAWTAAMDAGGRRHGWHDRVAGSEVVDVRPVPAGVEEEAPAPQAVVNLTAMRLVPAPGTAPARWRVGFDTGETLVVDGLVLIGRRPEPRPGESVRRLVPLRSEDMSLSKTHAQVQVASDGTLVVADRGSGNGSVLVRRGAARQLAAGRPATLLDGDRVHLGDRLMTVSRD